MEKRLRAGRPSERAGLIPVFADGRLIIHFDGTDRQFIAALNPDNGEILWETKRSGEMDERPDLKKAYGTPLVISTEGGAQVISPAANWVYGYDLQSGKELWKAAYGQLGFSTVPARLCWITRSSSPPATCSRDCWL